MRTQGLERGRLAGFVCLAALLFLAGCTSTPSSMPELDKLPKLTASAAIKADFYLDTTESMQGYLAQPPGKKNYFTALLDQIEGILSPRSSKNNFRTLGFADGEPKPILLSKYLKNRAAFDGKKTFIDRAIGHNSDKSGEGRETLKIIVTDLYQDSSDTGALAVGLAEAVKDPDRAVGILAIRSPFHGAVDDLPGGERLERGAADSMPFYVIVIGPVADVAWCLDEIEARLVLGSLSRDQKFAVLFGQRQVGELDQPLPLRQAAGFTLQPNVLIAGKKGRGMPALLGVSHDISLPRPDGFGSAPLKRPGLQVRVAAQPAIRALRWQNKKWVEDPDEVAAVAVEAHVIKVRQTALRKNSWHFFQIEFDAEKTDFAELTPWSIDDRSEVTRFKQNKEFDQTADKSKPGKTPNLRHFLQTLSANMYLRSIPLVRYSLFVQTN
jgi:hypothetical protein